MVAKTAFERILQGALGSDEADATAVKNILVAKIANGQLTSEAANVIASDVNVSLPDSGDSGGGDSGGGDSGGGDSGGGDSGGGDSGGGSGGGDAKTVNTVLKASTAANFTGTGAIDNITAYREIQNGTNVFFPFDLYTIDGADEIDSLEMEINETVTPKGINNIENVTVKLNANAAATVNFSNSNAITQLNNTGSEHDLTVSGLPKKITKVVWKDGDATNGDFTINIAASVLGNSDDKVTVDVSNITAGADADFKIGPATAAAGQGYNTVTFNSIGNVNNSINFSDNNNDSLTKMNVTGTQKITFNAIPASITEIDASAMTDGGMVTPTLTATTTKVTGGAGDDTIVYGGNYDHTTIVVDGGAGTDTLSITSAKAVAVTSALTDSALKNAEVIKVSDALGGNVNLNYFNGASTLHLEDGSGAHTVTVKSGDTVKVGGGATGTLTGTLTIALNTDGTNDKVTLDLGGDAADDDDAGNDQAITASNVDHLTIKTSGATDQVLGAVTTQNAISGDKQLTITGGTSITFGIITGAEKIDASGLTGSAALTMVTGQSNAGGIEVIGGPGDDTLFGTTDGGDLFELNGGDNTITIEQAAQSKNTIKNINLGTASGKVDLINIDLSQINAANAVVNTVTFTMSDTGNTDSTAAAITVANVSSTVTDADLVKMSGTYANTAALITALDSSEQFTLSGTLDNDDAVLFAYKTAADGDINIDALYMGTGANDSANFNGGATIITLTGAASQFANLDSTDFAYVA